MEVQLLIPYVAFVFTYLFMFQPEPQTPSETVVATLLKAGPILYLELYVVFLGVYSEDRAKHLDNTKIVMTFTSLLLSSLGDTCIVVDTLFFKGMFFYALAHLVRIIGLCSILKRFWKFNSTLDFKLFLLGSVWQIISTGLKELWSDIRSGVRIFQHVMSLIGTLVILVIFVATSFVVQLYFLLLLSMAALHVLSYFKNRSQSTELGVIGGLLFVLSDSLLVVSIVKKTRVALSMLLYYSAQCALAASAIWISSSPASPAK